MDNTSFPPEIGTSHPRMDAWSKVTGSEKYSVDRCGSQDLWTGVKRAWVPHARLSHIDTALASALDGVEAVLTHQDIAGTNRQGVVRQDQPVLVDSLIRHCGDAVALVVAKDKATVNRALDLITVFSEPLPGIFSMDQALDPKTRVIHPDHSTGNTLLSGTLTKGDGGDSLPDCPCRVELTIDLPMQEHVCLETECGRALFKDNRLTITASTQTPFRDRHEVAQALGLSPAQVLVVAPFLGGGFGGKDGITVQSLLGLAAMACPGRPVNMVWNREESFVASPKRHPAHLHYQLGVLENGVLDSLKVEAKFDTGPYDHLGGVVLALAMEHAGGPYAIPNVYIHGQAVYTNNPLAGAFRGFGVPQVMSAMEQVVDMAARKLGITPLEIRKKNCLSKGMKTPVGNTLTTSTGIRQCLETLETHPLYRLSDKWKSRASGHILRGVGVACAMHGMGYGPVVPDTANARLELTSQGRFKIYCGVSDMGQGNSTTFLQVAGNLLNQTIESLELVLPDTDRTLPCGSASASRTTFTFAHALADAADQLRERICKRAADSLMVQDPDQFILAPGCLRHLTTGNDFPLAFVAGLMNKSERTVTSRYRAPAAKARVSPDTALQMHGVPHEIFSYTAHLSRVSIDTLTGRIQVVKYLAVTDCGRLINPDLYEQQMHGAIAQGLGYALFEAFTTDQGIPLTRDLSTYIIPGAMDLPEMELISVGTWEQKGPFGMKGVGEVGIDVPLACIANAVADACGKRPEQWPLTPERMLALLLSDP